MAVQLQKIEGKADREQDGEARLDYSKGSGNRQTAYHDQQRLEEGPAHEFSTC